jgi:WD40 repeat protein
MGKISFCQRGEDGNYQEFFYQTEGEKVLPRSAKVTFNPQSGLVPFCRQGSLILFPLQPLCNRQITLQGDASSIEQVIMQGNHIFFSTSSHKLFNWKKNSEGTFDLLQTLEGVAQFAIHKQRVIAYIENQSFEVKKIDAKGLLVDSDTIVWEDDWIPGHLLLYATQHVVFLGSQQTGAIKIYRDNSKGKLTLTQTLSMTIFAATINQIHAQDPFLFATSSTGLIEIWKMDPRGHYEHLQTLNFESEVVEIKTEDRFLVIGCANGSCSFWWLSQEGKFDKLKTLLTINGKLTSLAIDNGLVITGYSNGKIRVRDFNIAAKKGSEDRQKPLES